MAALGFSLVREHFNVFPTDDALTQTLVALTRAAPCTFATSETVTGSYAQAKTLYGRFGAAVESMEGAAAAQVCTAFGTAFAELRGISNRVGERDKALWNIGGAVRAVNQAVLTYVRAAHGVVGARDEA